MWCYLLLALPGQVLRWVGPQWSPWPCPLGRAYRSAATGYNGNDLDFLSTLNGTMSYSWASV